jgi:hypothetical protein
VNRSGSPFIADKHPESRNTGQNGALMIRFKAQHLGVETAAAFDFLGCRTNPDAMMVKFQDLYRHLE